MTKDTAKAVGVAAVSAASFLGAWVTGDPNALWGLAAAAFIVYHW